MRPKIKFLTTFFVGATITLLACQVMAKETITPICAECHTGDSETLWGTLVPGSQSDTSAKVLVGKDVWEVHYDNKSNLKKMATIKDLADEKAVRVRFRPGKEGWVYAEEISSKSNYKFKNPDDIITITEVAELLKKSPEEGNYLIVDARGYDNYIEGHLPNAVLIPHYRFQAFKDRMPEDKNTQIVAYCRGYS
jgi:hypothetical protein